MGSLPANLTRLEFCRVEFALEFQDAFTLTREKALRLRRDLLQAARDLAELTGEGEGGWRELFDPGLPADSLLQRRHQRPGPGFVLSPPCEPETSLEAGDVFLLRALFLGRSVSRLGFFARVLSLLGERGFHRGEGPFELAGIEGEDGSGRRSPLWLPGDDLEEIAPPLLDAAWLLAGRRGEGGGRCLRFLTPARVLSRGRPLFRPTFRDLFPFILRRVTGLCAAHCQVELLGDPAPLLAAAAAVETAGGKLAWEDWRTLEGDGGETELGGVAGSLALRGEALEEIAWVLELGVLLQVGRGAAYGAGCYVLEPLEG